MATATTTKATKRAKLICPFCGSNEGIKIDLNDPYQTLTCEACGEEGTPHEFSEKAAENAIRWAATVAWLDNAPAE